MLLLAATAGRLGGGGGVEIPLVRILLAFLLCAIIAGLAILLIRQRTGRGDLRGDLGGWLRQVTPARGVIEVVEVRRLTIHADIGLVRHGGREYLMVLQAGGMRVLNEGAAPPVPSP